MEKQIKYKIIMKRTLVLFTLVFILSILSNTLLAAPEQNYIVYIDSNNYVVKTDITGEVVFTSDDASAAIQWAIDNLPVTGINGGEVLIEKGSYPLTNCVTVKDNIWLHGKGASTKLYTDGQLVEAIIIQDASMAVVSDLSLENKNNEIKSASGVSIDRGVNCQVLNITVAGFRNGVVNSGESSLSLINGNQLNNNKTNIAIQDGGGVIGRWLPLLITENIIRGGNTGIYCNAMVTNIINNEITGVLDRGIFAKTNSIVISGNKLNDIGGDYAIFGTGAEFNCTYNIISDVKGGGIRTRDRWGVFMGNLITNCGTKEKPVIGIHIESDDKPEGPGESKVVFRNIIKNENGQGGLEYGIREEGINNIIGQNQIGGFSKEAVYSEGDGSIVADNKTNEFK